MADLYTLWLPDVSAGQPNDRVGSQIQQAGLVEQGNVATEQIATSNIDLTLNGVFDFGTRFTPKAVKELESLGKGSYSAVPLFGEGDELRRESAYYEVQNVDVSPAQQNTEGAATYTVSLSEAGTKQDHWRAVRTTVETVDTLFTGSDTSYVAIPNEATKTQWYDSETGTEKATATDTVEAEFGTVARFDPSDSTFSDPILLYELAFDREGRVDAKVWDDRDREKYWTFTDSQSNSVSFNQWAHVFHPGWEFDGQPVIDTGRLRVWFGTPGFADTLVVGSGETYTIPAGTTEVYSDTDVDGTLDVQGTLVLTGTTQDLYVETWDDPNNEWDAQNLESGTWDLIDVDITTIGPGEVQAQLLWTDGNSLDRVDGIFDRGDDSVLWVEPDNETATAQDIQDTIEPIARKTDQNVAPAQTVIARSETRS